MKYEVEVLGRTVITIEAASIEEARNTVARRAKRGDYDEALTEDVNAYSAREIPQDSRTAPNRP